MSKTSIKGNDLFPIFLKLEHLNTLVVGGGNVGLEKISALLRNSPVPVTVVRLPATEVAAEVGNPMGGTMVMAGAYAAITGLVQLDSLVAAMEESIPSYRRQHIESNERALRAGFDTAPAGTGAPRAWQEEEVSA